MLKGIQSAADAHRALEVGCEGIVVTNHAGRQVDGAVGSLEVLPEIVQAVGDSTCSALPVLFESTDNVASRDDNNLRLRNSYWRGHLQGYCARRACGGSRAAMGLGHGARGGVWVSACHEVPSCGKKHLFSH